MFDFGIFSYLSFLMECSYMTPRTPAVIVMMGNHKIIPHRRIKFVTHLSRVTLHAIPLTKVDLGVTSKSPKGQSKWPTI